MKNLGMLIWLSQLGISVAVPPAVLILLSVWLRNRFELGIWVIITGAVLGILFAVRGLRSCLKAMELMARDKKKEEPPLAFNDHD